MRILILLLVFLCGCATTPQPDIAQLKANERQRQIAAHPQWPKYIKDSISRGELLIGMTKSQVIATLGNPIDRKSEDVWFFGNHILRYNQFVPNYKVCTIFQFGKLVKVKNYE